jgi:serine/threonine protein kinase
MPLAAGHTLSFYEILGPLGAGGMGEVYLARDTRLDREVAIKVLPEELADDEERLRRFEREAKTLASLNHTNIAGIHGIDQVDDICFIAMELVPGEDLSQRLDRGALPVSEALDVCRQIAEGLEVAHEAGIVHRDLKPANVRITPGGVVKVLDFGLAKPIHASPNGEGTSAAESDSFLMTEEGLVLGTPTYMSPEQARGKPVDRRTDIWAFGCVLYECLTGERAFRGGSLTDILASIVGEEPDFSRLPRLPASVRALLVRCLKKDPRVRLRDIGEARVLLQASDLEASEAGVTASAQAGRTPGFLSAAGFVVLGATLGALVLESMR